DAFRPDAVLVVVVLPGFGHADAGLAGGVGVGDVVFVVGGAVVVNLFFLDGIGHLFAVAVYRQIRETPVPGIGIGGARHSLGSDFLIPHHQVDGDLTRALAVLVVGVVPSLGALDIGRYQRVGDGETTLAVGFDLGLVPGH